MDHVTRLQLVGKVTYYLGWITAICGALVHFNIGIRMFVAINLPQRNLLEASLFFLLMCIASELRAAQTKHPA
jgi:hypothetical protein